MLGMTDRRFFSTFILIVLILTLFTGCINKNNETEKNMENVVEENTPVDHKPKLPNWTDGNYHDYESTKQMLFDLNNRFPDLVSVFSIGKSVLGRDIWCIKITNKKSKEKKFSCLIDGCIHGNEWEAGEACLYLAEYLLINFGYNKTTTGVLNKTNVYLVPLVNPDGRENDERWNANGIDLNRNYDVHFGRILGRSFRLGKLFGRIKIPGFKIPGTKIIITNAGRYPFSEPETSAMRDLMRKINKEKFSFYVCCHTALHCITGPSELVYFPEYKVTEQQKRVIDYVKKWVEENTEYSAYYEKTKTFGCGSAGDWCFKEFRIPTFTFELLSKDYEPMFGHGKHDHLVHWMKTVLPVFLYLLTNVEKLHNWETPDNQPCLPKGVPPPPLTP